MPLLSTQRYVQGILDGLPLPGAIPDLKAQITPPVVQNLSGPIAFVWGSSMRAERQSGPRGKPGQAGFKKLLWDTDVWLVYLTNPNNADVDAEFPAIVDAVMAALWSTQMTTQIDVNGVPCQQGTPGASQILSIGENMRLEYDQVHTPQTQRMLYYAARLTCEVYEAVNA